MFWPRLPAVFDAVRRRAGDGEVTACILALAAVAVRIAPPGAGSIYPPCPFKWATGWECAGCGALRALHALTDLNLHGAWTLNPLFVLFLAGFCITTSVRAAPSLRVPLPAWFLPAVPVVIVFFWIGRNF